MAFVRRSLWRAVIRIVPIGETGEFGGVELEYKPLWQEEAEEYFKGKCSLLTNHIGNGIKIIVV